MTCDKLHISDATFREMQLKLEEAISDAQVLDAENERLKHELGKARMEVRRLEMERQSQPSPWPMLPELPK